MINRDMHPVLLQTLTSETDIYGQKRLTITKTEYIEMDIKLQQQTNINAPNYIDADALGLTKYPAINTHQQIVDCGTTYRITQVFKTGRFVQVYLKEENGFNKSI